MGADLCSVHPRTDGRGLCGKVRLLLDLLVLDQTDLDVVLTLLEGEGTALDIVVAGLQGDGDLHGAVVLLGDLVGALEGSGVALTQQGSGLGDLDLLAAELVDSGVAGQAAEADLSLVSALQGLAAGSEHEGDHQQCHNDRQNANRLLHNQKSPFKMLRAGIRPFVHIIADFSEFVKCFSQIRNTLYKT